MACERCGGDSALLLPGMTCRCGKTAAASDPAGAWHGPAARPTLLMRVARLSRTGRVLLAAGVGLTVLALAATAVGLSGGEREPAAEASEGRDGVPGGAGDLGDIGGLGGAPQRIQPTTPPSVDPSESPSPSPSPTASPPKRPGGGAERSRRALYSAWAGPGCSGGGRYTESGRFRDGFDGWYTVNTGGHSGNGCDGRFTAVPMSGSRTKDKDGSVTWSWYVGSGYETCSVSVIIPKAPRPEDVAGAPTTYNVLADPDDADSTIKSFEIDQVELRGRGAIVEKIPVRDQQLTIQLVDRGQNRGQGRESQHHAAAQMRADCRV
ncbi:adhesin [Streptomyces sp. NPDC058572]|uniref:adhesin n=1 Tax=Streptomyces sp. NPDC058572 TaxID=3346546 RepID=UPI00365FC361